MKKLAVQIELQKALWHPSFIWLWQVCKSINQMQKLLTIAQFFIIYSSVIFTMTVYSCVVLQTNYHETCFDIPISIKSSLKKHSFCNCIMAKVSFFCKQSVLERKKKSGEWNFFLYEIALNKNMCEYEPCCVLCALCNKKIKTFFSKKKTYSCW